MIQRKILEKDFDLVVESMYKRGQNSSSLDLLKTLLPRRNELIKRGDELREERNQITAQYSGKIEDPKILEKIKYIKTTLEENTLKLSSLEEELDNILLDIPNIVDESVPLGKSEKENKEIMKWGDIPKFSFTPRSHEDIGRDMGILDIPRGVKISGSRFYTLRGDGALLERAIAQFFLDKAWEAGYQEIFAPFLVKEQTMVGTGQLPKFKDEVFKIEDTDLYLIPTSEVSVTALHKDEILKKEELPIRYCSYSSCFRKEAGSYGRDTKGIFRVHQFQKVELLHFSLPENSMEELERMVLHSQSLLEALEIPYRKMLLCSGDIGFSSQKTYDLEVFLPFEGRYREISSCSNCGSFQAVRANIKYKDTQGKNQYLHTLNGSGLAVGRTWVAILENYQNEDGTVRVPEVLQKYMRGKKIIGEIK